MIRTFVTILMISHLPALADCAKSFAVLRNESTIIPAGNSYSHAYTQGFVADKISRCPGISGSDDYAKHLFIYNLTVRNNCEIVGRLYRRLLWPLSHALETCMKLAKVADVAWDPETGPTLLKRYEDACEDYKNYLAIANRVCSAYGDESIAEARIVPADTARTEEKRSDEVERSHMVCMNELLRNLTWRSGRVGKIPGRLLNPPSTSSLDAQFSDAATKMRIQINKVYTALQDRFTDRSGDSADGISEDLLSCKNASAGIDSFEQFYQKEIFGGLIRMYDDSVAAAGFFGKLTTLGKTQQNRTAGFGAGDSPTPSGANPILVKANNASIDGVMADYCPAEESLTPTEKALRDSVFYVEKPKTGEVGSLFHAQTTDAKGAAHTYEVTAGHVAMTNIFDQNSQEMAELKTAPAGRRFDAQDAGQYEYSRDELDRKHDVAIRPTGYGPGLIVKTAAAEPKIGQEFELAGHPVESYGMNYINIVCTFMGYGTREVSGYYALQCPAAEISLGGMSGGPMVDPQSGQVWGVNANQGGYYDANGDRLRENNMVFVSPIQQDPSGAILTGPQGYRYSTNCYDIGSIVSKPCYITPNGTYYP